MKKFLFVVVAMVVLGSAQAQTVFKNKVERVTGTEFYFGPKFGFNIASISDGLNKSKFSFQLGAFAEFKFNDLYRRSCCILAKEIWENPMAIKCGGV